MATTLRLLLLLIHYAAVSVIVYYVGDLMSKDTSGIGVGPNALVLLLLIISVIQHTKQFILSLINNKNKKTQL